MSRSFSVLESLAPPATDTLRKSVVAGMTADPSGEIADEAVGVVSAGVADMAGVTVPLSLLASWVAWGAGAAEQGGVSLWSVLDGQFISHQRFRPSPWPPWF